MGINPSHVKTRFLHDVKNAVFRWSSKSFIDEATKVQEEYYVLGKLYFIFIVL